jgi:hypothetical protein
MINPKNPKQIAFPHTIPTPVINGKRYVWNDVNGGAKPIGYFGLVTNSFWGGLIHKLGFVKELGFWAALDKNDPNTQRVRGFYLADPKELTALGKQVFQAFNADKEILYMMLEDIPQTPEDMEERRKIEKEAMNIGVLSGDFKHISASATETLKSLIDAAKYEQKMEKEAELLAKQKAKEEIVESVESDPATDLIKQAKARRKTASVGA